MSEIYIPGDQLAEAFAELDGEASAHEIVEAVRSVVDRFTVERGLEVEEQVGEALAELSARVDGVAATFDRIERREAEPEIRRYLRMRHPTARLES